MTKQSNPQSIKRSQESLGALFFDTPASADVLFLKSSTDVGVERNGGRNGARLAPQAFLATFKKLTQHAGWKPRRLAEVEVADEALERRDFAQAQRQEGERIRGHLEAGAALCHLGGGHDHVYPLLCALEQKFQRIVVINVDAHADTRTDAEANSGTPFRQFAETTIREFHLFQVGLHPFANAASTLSEFTRGKQSILWRAGVTEADLRNLRETLRSLVGPDTAVVFSLDADALSGALVPGVSAVNGSGLSYQELQAIWAVYAELKFTHPKYLGIYELNPVYDTVSSTSMRTLANFVFDAFR